MISTNCSSKLKDSLDKKIKDLFSNEIVDSYQLSDGSSYIGWKLQVGELLLKI